VHESEKWKWSRSVVSDPQWPHGLQPSRLLHPWDFPGRSTGVGCHCLLQYACYLFLIYSPSVRSVQFLSFIEPIFAWNVSSVSIILLKRSLVFPILFFPSIFFCIGHWGRLSYLSLQFFGTLHSRVYLSFSPLPFASLLFTAVCMASSENHFAFLHFFFLGMGLSLPPVQCHKSPSIVLQALCLSDLIPWIYFPLPLYNCKGYGLGQAWLV